MMQIGAVGIGLKGPGGNGMSAAEHPRRAPLRIALLTSRDCPRERLALPAYDAHCQFSQLPALGS
jgi:hypothetical protein